MNGGRSPFYFHLFSTRFVFTFSLSCYPFLARPGREPNIADAPSYIAAGFRVNYSLID